MKIKLLFLALLALIIASSCTIKQSIEYNEDLSGRHSLLFDMSEFMEEMKGLYPEGETEMNKDSDIQESLNELSTIFKSQEGVSNIQNINRSDEGIFGFSFDFENTEALNSGMATYLENDQAKEKGKNNYYQKKKTLVLNFDKTSLGSLGSELQSEEMQMMLSSIDYKIELSFPFPIKKVDNPLYTLSADRKNLEASIALVALLDGSENLSAKIKW
ncbi:MAG: hypothetical protein H6579_04370 [Chitinophagales bacterium]|nr:hypothetical protein [Chitinophagales bacterium]